MVGLGTRATRAGSGERLGKGSAVPFQLSEAPLITHHPPEGNSNKILSSLGPQDQAAEKAFRPYTTPAGPSPGWLLSTSPPTPPSGPSGIPPPGPKLLSAFPRPCPPGPLAGSSLLSAQVLLILSGEAGCRVPQGAGPDHQSPKQLPLFPHKPSGLRKVLQTSHP